MQPNLRGDHIGRLSTLSEGNRDAAIAIWRAWSRLVDCLYPASCAACDASIDAGLGMCALCRESLLPIEASCSRCASPHHDGSDAPCAECRGVHRALDSTTAAYEYGGQLAVALRRLKFTGRSDVASALAPLLIESFRACASRCEIAIPLPLHLRRQRRRGFNQADRLLTPLAKQVGTQVQGRALFRPLYTPPQAQLSAQARARNLRGVFWADPARVAGKSVLLLDDIRTTGATTEAAAFALKAAGAEQVHAFVVARAERQMRD